MAIPFLLQASMPSMKTAENVDGRQNFSVPSMKTARNVDGRLNFCVSECDDTKRAAPYHLEAALFMFMVI